MYKTSLISFFALFAVFTLFLVGCIFPSDDNYVPNFPNLTIKPNATTPVYNNSTQNTTTQNNPVQNTTVQNSTTQNRTTQNSTFQNNSAQNNSTLVNNSQDPQIPTPIMEPISIERYRDFLQNQQIKQAIGELTPVENNFLEASIAQLENNDLSTWNELENRFPPRYPETLLTQQEVKHIWLRRIAFSFYQEMHRKVPWSLLNYNSEDLGYLLSFCTDITSTHRTTLQKNGTINFNYFDYSCGQFFDATTPTHDKFEPILIWETNPTQTYSTSVNLLGAKRITNQRQLIDGLIVSMREQGWSHIGSQEDQNYLIGDSIGMLTSLNRLNTLKRSGSGWTSVYLASLLRTWNVPVKTGESNGHGHVLFPTEHIGLWSGDFVYGSLSRFPVDDAYFSTTQFNALFSLPFCQAVSEKAKLELRRTLHYYDNLMYYVDIYYGQNGYCAQQSQYVQKLVQSTKPNEDECNADPANVKIVGQWTPPFTQDEINQWSQIISQYATQNNICN